MRKLFRFAGGFTLIEIIVTLTIMAIIFSIAANGFNRVNSGTNLTLATETLASDLRSAALSALNSEQFQLQTPGGWGIYFDGVNNTYTIFADLNSNKTYNTNEKFKTVVLTKNIVNPAVFFNSVGIPNAQGSVLFLNATAIPYYEGTLITSGTGDLEIQFKDNVTSATKSVFVNPLGAVSF